jgi:hypothetical protein
MKVDRAELFWVAGFIEGEGCFSGYRGAGRIIVSQKNREPLDRLQKSFGGNMYWNPNGKIWQWAVYGPVSVGLMMTIYPVLSRRRQQQAAAAIAAWRARPLWNRRRSACEKGHPLSEANTYRWEKRVSTRGCRVCRNDNVRRWRSRKKVANANR